MEDESQPSTSKSKVLHVFPKAVKYDRAANTDDDNSQENIRIKVTHDINLQDTASFPQLHKVRLKQKTAVRHHPQTTRERTDFGWEPSVITCPNCLSYIETDVFYDNTRITHIIAASLFPVCLCLLPYCTTEFKDAVHYCPRCNIYLGTKFGSGRKVFSCFLK